MIIPPKRKNTRPKQRHRQKQRRRPQKQRLRRARGFWSAETQGFCWGRSDGWNRRRFFRYEISLDLFRKFRWFWVFDDSFHDVDVLVLFQHFSRISFRFAEADLVLELVSFLLIFCWFSGCPSWLPIVLVTFWSFWSFWSPIWIHMGYQTGRSKFLDRQRIYPLVIVRKWWLGDWGHGIASHELGFPMVNDRAKQGIFRWGFWPARITWYQDVPM